MRKIDPSKKKRGSALIITLLVITTLTGLTIGFSEESSVELNLAGFSRDGYRAYQMARSGVHFALAVLANDEDKNMDSLREDWGQAGTQPFPYEFPEEMSVSGKIVDENSKLNINYLIDEKGEIPEGSKRVEQASRLFKALGFEENLLDPLLDWLDSDNEKRPDGAESFFYQNLEEPYSCANGPFLSIGQLSLVKGFRGIVPSGEKGENRLTDFFTIFGDGKININTASQEILQSLSDNFDPSIAEAIIEYRQEEDFIKVDDLKKIPGIDGAIFSGISKWVTVKSSAFSIEARVESREAVAGINAFAVRKEEKPVLVYWRVI